MLASFADAVFTEWFWQPIFYAIVTWPIPLVFAIVVIPVWLVYKSRSKKKLSNKATNKSINTILIGIFCLWILSYFVILAINRIIEMQRASPYGVSPQQRQINEVSSYLIGQVQFVVPILSLLLGLILLLYLNHSKTRRRYRLVALMGPVLAVVFVLYFAIGGFYA